MNLMLQVLAVISSMRKINYFTEDPATLAQGGFHSRSWLSAVACYGFTFCSQQCMAIPTSDPDFVQTRPFTQAEKMGSIATVSLINLIANPAQYKGKMLSVRGYLHVQYEDNRLYVCKDYGDYLIKESALDVSFAP